MTTGLPTMRGTVCGRVVPGRPPGTTGVRLVNTASDARVDDQVSWGGVPVVAPGPVL